MQEKPSRAELMRIAADAGRYNRSSKKKPTPYRASNHKYHVHGVREDLAKEHKPSHISYYTDSISSLENGFDTYADYWKRIYSGFYSVLTGGFMTTLYIDRIY